MADAQAKIVVAERLSDQAMNRLGEVGDVALLQSCEAHSLRAAVQHHGPVPSGVESDGEPLPRNQPADYF